MATEKEKLELFRKSLSKDCDDTRKMIKTISEIYSRYGLCGSMYNVSIIYNNKLSEVLHHYYKYNRDFFNGSFLSHIVIKYLDDLHMEARLLLDGIIKRIRVIGIKGIISSSPDPIVVYCIKRYKELTDQIFEFDLKTDVDKCLNSFSMKKSVEGIILNKELTLKELLPDLETLHIDSSNLENLFPSDEEYERIQALDEFFSNLYDEIVKTMKDEKKK